LNVWGFADEDFFGADTIVLSSARGVSNHVWEHLVVDPMDPEQRVAELERQLREAKAVAWRAQSRGGTGVPLANYIAQESYSPSASYGTALATAPRRVPIGFLLAELLPFRWWYLFAMFMVAIPPVIVWIMQPALFLPAAAIVLLAIYAFQFQRARARIALLKWGQVTTVTGAEVLSQGTYYGGVTYSNVVLPVARGWTVTRSLWSGPKTKTRIRYQLDGYQGEITVGGREYVDGVVLADRRKPERALCVTSFPYDLDRDDSGNWVGRLRVRLQIGMACWLLIMIGWVGGAAVMYQNYQSYRTSLPTAAPRSTVPTRPSTTAAAPGTAVIVNGANESRSIVCDMNDVTINGAGNRVDISGHCRSLTVSGSENHVSVDVSDVITANGIENLVTFRAGSPQINSGISNVVRPG
jgi:hypothetical protein